MSLDTVKLIFSQRYNASVNDLSAESLIVDICNDSLEVLELLMYIEEEFGVEVPDDVAQDLKTLGDIAAFMDNNIPEDTVAEISEKLRENN
ncbi:MAG: acyl carrier protein [Clostridia bacterium]|nr:acyl carrier protein [Clostridia bacterium]MBQ2272095.1 acyl carrier protein [Clostridia bacterium]MBQ5820448.1 acyl carrier protein [Clostridia bacterium]